MATAQTLITSGVNYHDKWEKKINEDYTLESYFKSFSSNKYNFSGTRSIKINQLLPVAPEPYNINTADGRGRTGPIREMQDVMQELQMGQTLAYSASVDKHNYVDQNELKTATQVIRVQNREIVIPTVDKHTSNTIGNYAGIKVTLPAAVDVENIVKTIFDLRTTLTNKGVPIEKGTLFVRSTEFAILCQNKAFLNYEKAGTKGIVRAAVGQIAAMKVVEVPDPRMPADCPFIFALPSSFLTPMKIKEVRPMRDVQGIFGLVVDAAYYYDCFVLMGGCYGLASMWLPSASVPVTPTMTPDATIQGVQPRYVPGTTTVTLSSSTAGATIKYTLDGNDPRTSPTALTYSDPIPTTEWSGTVKVTAAAISSGGVVSGIAKGDFFPTA